MSDFEKALHEMFDHIWDCEIEHPIFQDTVGELMQAVLQVYDSIKQEWTPCSERLPDDSKDYLVCLSDDVLEDYSDFSEVMIMPYDADCEAFGWWVDRYDPISLGFVDSDFNEFEVLAWRPVPESYKEGESDATL